VPAYRCLGGRNFFRPGASKVGCDPEFGEHPDEPFGGIPLPWFDAVAVIMLEFVVIVVVTFA